MAPKLNLKQDQPFAKVLAAIAQNNENLEKTLKTLSRLIDTFDNKSEANKNKIIVEIMALQKDVKTLQAQLNESENKTNLMSQTLTQTSINQKMEILQFKNWVEFQIFAGNPQFSAYTYRDTDNLFEINAVKNKQLLVYIGETPKINIMLRSWLSNQLMVSQERIMEGTIEL